MNYNIINTGSDGNAIIIEDIILIDCGVSFKKMKDYYKKLQIVFLTHIHSDHFNKTTIKKLAKERPTLRFACCEWLVNELVNCGVSIKNIDLLDIGKKYDYGIAKVKPIKLYHDVENCGYRIYINKKKAIYITDTHTLEGIEAKDYDLYLIEANYEEDKIQEKIEYKKANGKYIYEYRSMESHLSREQTDEFLINNMGERSTYEYLHISREPIIEKREENE